MRGDEITRTCRIVDLGLIDYQEAYRLQSKTVADAMRNGDNILYLCEHPPVFTLGRLSSDEDFIISKEKIQSQGIKIINMDRGGKITFHGPGQVVLYPIFNLSHFGKDLKLFMDKLEQVAIDLLEPFDIVADRAKGQRGVWVNQRKIASIGIGVRKWISFHGMAININTDLNYFSMIKPCGLDVEMASMRLIRGTEINICEVKKRLIESFCKNFNLNTVAEITK